MTIEEYIRNNIGEKLINTFKNYNVIICNDISYAQFISDNDLIFNIKTGSSQLSQVKGVFEQSTATQIYFKCTTNNQQEILSVLNEFVIEENGKVFQTSDNKFYVLSLYNTPSIISYQNERVNNDTLSITYGMFTLSTYATIISQDQVKFNFSRYNTDTTTIEIGEISALLSYSINDVYTYNYVPTDDELGKQAYNSQSINISLTFLKLDDLVTQYFVKNKHNLKKQKLKLVEINMNREYQYEGYVTQLSESSNSNIPQIQLMFVITKYIGE